MNNTDIRIAAKEANLHLWQVAEGLGICDSAFSRKLRHELPEDEKAKIRSVIKELSQK